MRHFHLFWFGQNLYEYFRKNKYVDSKNVPSIFYRALNRTNVYEYFYWLNKSKINIQYNSVKWIPHSSSGAASGAA